MSGEAWLFLFSVIMSAVLLFTAVFFNPIEARAGTRALTTVSSVALQIIMFSDLGAYESFMWLLWMGWECDYLNPIDLCNKLNQFVLPEMIAHAFMTTLFLLSFQVVAFLLNAPLLAYNVNKVVNRNHMFDATEIFRTLSQHKKESFFKLGFYLIFFFYALYRMILALVADD
ncbi:ER-derived vesicles protein ERV14 [Pseudohyphozyma bogoriensis]|nr:ER-derived vesicles protein ERV14 [Pseudohyphozyma bogoriensis]